MKVVDKRMFTADGELREDFRHLETAADKASARPAEPPAQPAQAPPEPPADERQAAESQPAAAEAGVPASGDAVQMPPAEGDLGSPGFLDLVGMLAEPIAVYLGDAKLPDGGSAENLEAARFYIDLLDVLQAKTEGNLTDQERSVLEDLLYQLRMRYVRKRG